MFRMLIVEDIPSTLEQLQALFSEAIPESQIDTSETVNKGLELVKRARERQQHYDVAILDFKLPQGMGENPEVDESLCLAIRNAMPKTLVAHLTAFPDDEVVQKHLRGVHWEQIGLRSLALSKLDVDSPARLVNELKAFLYGSLIEEQMADLFGKGGAPTSEAWGQGGRSSGGGGRITHRLADLCHDIESHWNDLNPDLKQRIQSVFHVKEMEDGSVRASLL